MRFKRRRGWSSPMVMRDPDSNSRSLREHNVGLPAILVEAGTPQTAMREARRRCAPVLLSRGVLAGHDFHELEITGLDSPREFVIVLPAPGEPDDHVRALIDALRRHATPVLITTTESSDR